MTKTLSITEYHLCSDCHKSLDVPGAKPHTWETGCMDKRGKPNKNGGLCCCEYYEGD